MTMNSHATETPKKRLTAVASPPRHRVEEAGEVQAHLQADRSRRRTRPRRRRCAPRSRATGRSAPAAARSRTAGGRVERDHRHRRQRGLGAERDQERQRRCAPASARRAAPSTGSAPNSASTRRNGQSSGVTQARTWASVKVSIAQSRQRAQPTTVGIACSVRCRYSTSVVSIHGPAIASTATAAIDLGHERQRRLVDLRRRLEDADDAGRPRAR